MKFAIATLGCKVNTYESTAMSELLKVAGYTEVPFKEKSDIYIINTCTVTNTADSKSYKTIRSAIKQNEDAIVVVVGCMIQNDSTKTESIDGVDIIIGNKNKTEIVNLIEKQLSTKSRIVDIKDVDTSEFEDMMISDSSRTRAFVKIQDGCENFCAYCIIPYTRGKVSSKHPDDVINEVEKLVATGHKEIVLTGIHTGHYGSDLKDVTFFKLLSRLVKTSGLERLRISSIEMNEITDEIINLFKENPVLVDHMHIPIQSGNNKVLKDMNRKYLKEDFIEKINQLRKVRPNMSITSDVIFGFPGESDEEYEDTINTIKKVNFSGLHVFPYSKRDGTVAATMKNEVDGRVKKERVKKALMLSKELEHNYMTKFLGDEIVFIPEIQRDGMLQGHTGNYLNIKVEGPVELLHQDVKVILKEIKYPYITGEIVKK